MGHLVIQLERTDDALELDPETLARYAQALAWTWRALGITAGNRVAVYDYGSSPAAYLASRAFAPYLDRGAAEITETMVLCVDGLPDNARRVGHVLRHFKPHYLFVRAEAVPLLVDGPTAIAREERVAVLVVASEEQPPATVDRAAWKRGWGREVRFMQRWDAAAWLGPECPRCGCLRVATDLYRAEVVDGLLTIAPSFSPTMEQAVTEIEVEELAGAPCCGASRRFRLV